MLNTWITTYYHVLVIFVINVIKYVPTNNKFKVGGHDGDSSFNSAEVFNYNTRIWRRISNISTRRTSVGVGVLKNLLYAVS